MALHIIIDGYNLIRQSIRLSFLDAGDLESGRTALLESLAAYHRRRPQHRLTVVFDGWQGGELRQTQDLFQGVKIIFSRRGERADEVIKRLLNNERQRALMVSSDRELQHWADRVGAAWVEASRFETMYLNANSNASAEGEDDSPAQGTKKKGPARRKSKRERLRQQRLKKL
ncbi:MAG: NYN domain-containing protein [Deltaproteobacteria bacterium]|nr:NYN domain-containing protein [Deltaproteobacteria bacterium]